MSWLAFNERVLSQACDVTLPIYERLRFLGIVSSNLDEFFMVRVAGLKHQLQDEVAESAADGMLPAEQLVAVTQRAHALVAEQYRVWREEIVPALLASEVRLLAAQDLSASQRTAIHTHFSATIFPALTPLAVDPGHPFPHLRNKSLNIAVLLRKDQRRRRRAASEVSLAVVQVPAVHARVVPVPQSQGRTFMLIEELIAAHVGDLFTGFRVVHTAPFRVTRNWDLNIDDEESEDLLSTVRDELRRRERGAAVRLEIDASASEELEAALVSALKLAAPDVYRVAGPLQPGDLVALADADPRPELRVESFIPAIPPPLRDAPIFATIAAHDVLLHHPYEALDPVVRFLAEAADDPNVLAIKQTLYRTSGDSAFVHALSRAAENGKQVTVLVEIKARFDEANNIAWARRLEDSGVHVVYGLIGLKTHCKVALVVRREGPRIRRYVHLGTGNYNQQTARHYSDLSLLTAREEIAEDASALFNMLTGYSDPPAWKRLAVAPLGLQERLVALIEREADHARRGEPARIVAKMNALVDPVVIRALYAASQAGVAIDLLVRGICCIRPGLAGLSENIRVTSIVDRFLEHSRVFAFGVGERTEVYLSSADWMPRNFVRRIEAMFPVEDPALRTRVLDEILAGALEDNTHAWRCDADGIYARVETTGPAKRSQYMLMEAARRAGGAEAASALRRLAQTRPPARASGETDRAEAS